uniref:Uncharacterized protein n=1 Tax=Panagrolaimus sp. ES5 TaxID=591445 RepID=A0AC34FRE8_9BILA
MALVIDRLFVFLGLFAVVYFLEAIGGSYMVSAVQSIERQFQIPSKLSGFISSASDISYIPTVVFISYFGGRGNRAKWIGAGCVLIALAHIMTATPNFIFPVKAPDLNLTKIEQQLHPSPNLLTENVTLKELFEFQPLKDRIPAKTREMVLQKFNGHSISERAIEDMKLKYTNHSSSSPYTVDDELINEAMYHFEEILHGNENVPTKVITILRQFVENRTKDHKNDLKTVRRAAIAHFAFCGKLVNDLRNTVDQLKCNRDGGNFGPLLIIFCALLGLGIGRTMPWSLGIPLIDDNVKRK